MFGGILGTILIARSSGSSSATLCPNRLATQQVSYHLDGYIMDVDDDRVWNNSERPTTRIVKQGKYQH